MVCLNEELARKDRADGEAIVEGLREQLKQGDKTLVGNKGYRKYLSSEGPKSTINEEKVKWEERFDGKWVLQTDLEEFSAEELEEMPKCKDPEIQKLFSDWCDAETNLATRLDLLPRAGKRCICKDEPPAVHIALDCGTKNSKDKETCMNCGGRVE